MTGEDASEENESRSRMTEKGCEWGEEIREEIKAHFGGVGTLPLVGERREPLEWRLTSRVKALDIENKSRVRPVGAAGGEK